MKVNEASFYESKWHFWQKATGVSESCEDGQILPPIILSADLSAEAQRKRKPWRKPIHRLLAPSQSSPIVPNRA
jgi:hypothetical protein